MNPKSNQLELKDALLLFLNEKQKTHPNLAEELKDLLDLSTSTAYRRLNGEKPFTCIYRSYCATQNGEIVPGKKEDNFYGKVNK